MKEEFPKPGLTINNDEAQKIPSDETFVVADDGSTKLPIYNNKRKPRGAFGFFKSALVKLRQRPAEKPKPPAANNEVTPQEKLKKFVGSMRPLHLQDNQSPPPSEPAMSRTPTVNGLVDMVAAPPSPAASYSSVLSGGTMSQYASASNLQELDGTMSQSASSNNLQELDHKQDGTTSKSASSNNLQELDHKHDGTMSQSASTSNLLELHKHEGTLRKYASTINLQELDKHGHGTMRQSASTSNLQELDNDEKEDPDEVFDALCADEMIDAKAEEFIARFYLQMRLQSQNHRHRKGKDKV